MSRCRPEGLAVCARAFQGDTAGFGGPPKGLNVCSNSDIISLISRLGEERREYEKSKREVKRARSPLFDS